MVAIHIRAPDGSQRGFRLLRDRIRIGRAADNDLALPDPKLSRRHAEILRTPEGHILRDLGSRNGTRLNGQRLRADRPIRPGDAIDLGSHHLTLNEETPGGGQQSLSTLQTIPPRDISDLEATKPDLDPAEQGRRHRILAHLIRAAGALTANRSLPELFERVLDQLFEVLPAERGCIALLEGHPPKPIVKASRTRHGAAFERLSRSITRRVLEDRVSLLVPRLLEDAGLSGQESLAASGVRSLMCAPLWFTAGSGQQDAVIGLIYLDSLEEPTCFTVEDLQFLSALANLAAIRIESARLHEESRDHEKLREELRKAGEIQASLLPQALPDVPGYELAASNRLCSTVGGDYYDFLLDRGQLLLALGDVSGKGTAAALLMAMLRAAVRAHWTEGLPAASLARANGTLCETIPENRYASMFLGRLDPAGGQFTFVNAGHYPPVIVRADGQVLSLGEGGPVLGVFPSASYTNNNCTIGLGDALVVFSDGVAEARNAGEEEFGQQGVAAIAVRERGREARGLHDAIFEQVTRHLGAARLNDDQTLIVVKRR
jgi:sigma-B regulation protein RsbU (phosphoserine phosphatase)